MPFLIIVTKTPNLHTVQLPYVSTLQVIAPTTGWIGLGMSTSGSMKGADLTFMWLANGTSNALVQFKFFSTYLQEIIHEYDL